MFVHYTRTLGHGPIYLLKAFQFSNGYMPWFGAGLWFAIWSLKRQTPIYVGFGKWCWPIGKWNIEINYRYGLKGQWYDQKSFDSSFMGKYTWKDISYLDKKNDFWLKTFINKKYVCLFSSLIDFSGTT